MKRIVIFFLSLSIISPLFAETILLESGKIIEAEIVERTDEYIKISFHGVPLTYYRNEIESINQEKVAPSFSGVSSKPLQQKKVKYLVYSEKNTSNLEAGEQIIFDSEEDNILYTNFKYLFMITFPPNWKSFYKKNAEGKKLYIGDEGDAIAFSPENDTSVFFHIIMERKHADLETAVKEQLAIITKEPDAELLSSPVELTISEEPAKKLVFSDRYSEKSIRYIIFHPQEKTTYILTFNCETLDAYNRYVYDFEKILQGVITGIAIQIPGV